MESLTELAAEKVPSKKLFISTEALKKAASMTIPLRVLRTNETPYMNDEIKCLMKERNRLCRNPALNRTAWLQKCKEVAKKMEEAKRMYWRNHLEIIKAGKDARLAWRTVGASRIMSNSQRERLYNIEADCTTVIRPKRTLLYKSMPTLVVGLATE